MKNNEWNIPTDYFEKNKKEFLPVRKFPNRNWIFALAAASIIGVGFFMLKGEGVGSKNLSTNAGGEFTKNENQKEKQNENENENEGKKGEEQGREGKMKESIGSKNLSTREEIAEELKEIPREELVEYLIYEDLDFTEQIN